MENSKLRDSSPVKETFYYDISENVKMFDPLNDSNQDDYYIKPTAQRNQQMDTTSIYTDNDVKTLLNPTLTENRYENEFLHFEDDKFSEEGSMKFNMNKNEKISNHHNNDNDALRKFKPVKAGSVSSISTLKSNENMGNGKVNKNDDLINFYDNNHDNNNNNDNNSDDNNDNNDNNNDNNNNNNDNDDAFFEELMNGNKSIYDDGRIRTIRRSLTDADIILTSERKSENMRNQRNSVDRKYCSSYSIQEREMGNSNTNDMNKKYRSNNLLTTNINRSMELFLNKQKSKKNSKVGSLPLYEIENTNFINLSKKKLENLIFIPDDSEYVRRIDASNNYLTSLPQNIGMFENLVELNASCNKLKTIPIEIGYLENLNILKLSNNEIESIPFQIGGLYNLKFLDVSNNNLTTFPREIYMLQKLEGLYASHNKIVKIPIDFVRLQKLKVLDLCENSLFCFKFKLSLLKGLEKLYLSNNQFPKFPYELAYMSNLCELYMDGNGLESIPDNIYYMKRLKVLRLNNNKIKKIPDNLCQLKKLRILRLQNNKIKNIPRNINKLKNLREFNIIIT